ncbi:MAG: hypothetical protein ACRD2Z_11875 [Thermoanaerobaculia bacterium]
MAKNGRIIVHEDRITKLEVGLAALKARVTYGFLALGVAVASPKLGGPSLPEAVAAGLRAVFGS